MFTGIIETLGTIESVSATGSGKTFWISCALTAELKIDQSLSHNGVCLTVEELDGHRFRVTAIQETLRKTNIGDWKTGDKVNIERAMLINGRLDGHFVQGHVDAVAMCVERADKQGSWEFRFEFPKKFAELIIEKGSVCVNGISLTAFNVKRKTFTVAIIPYTFEHTNIHAIEENDTVNIEFDLLGKYITRRLSLKSDNE